VPESVHGDGVGRLLGLDAGVAEDEGLHGHSLALRAVRLEELRGPGRGGGGGGGAGPRGGGRGGGGGGGLGLVPRGAARGWGAGGGRGAVLGEYRLGQEGPMGSLRCESWDGTVSRPPRRSHLGHGVRCLPVHVGAEQEGFGGLPRGAVAHLARSVYVERKTGGGGVGCGHKGGARCREGAGRARNGVPVSGTVVPVANFPGARPGPRASIPPSPPRHSQSLSSSRPPRSQVSERQEAFQPSPRQSLAPRHPRRCRPPWLVPPVPLPSP